MKKIILNFLFLCFLACASLTAQEKSDAYFNQVADDICKCSRGLEDLGNRAEVLQKEGKYEELSALADELDVVSKKYEECINGLMLKYSEIEGNREYERRTEKALQENCPMFENAGNNAGEPSSDGMEGEKAEIGGIAKNEEGTLEIEDVTPVDQQYENFALGVCNCLDEQPELKAEFEKLKLAGDEEKLAAFRKSAGNDLPGLAKCSEKLNNKYKEILDSKDSTEKKLNAFRKFCPFYLDLLGLLE